jgi:hypothetical protein
MTEWGRSVLFSTGVGLFLGMVGAFGTITYPFFPRMVVFAVIGVGGGLIVAGCIALTERLPGIAVRPLARRVVIGPDISSV